MTECQDITKYILFELLLTRLTCSLFLTLLQFLFWAFSILQGVKGGGTLNVFCFYYDFSIVVDKVSVLFMAL